ncbi:unnamed protein product [Pylaiella littoralis]
MSMKHIVPVGLTYIFVRCGGLICRPTHECRVLQYQDSPWINLPRAPGAVVMEYFPRPSHQNRWIAGKVGSTLAKKKNALTHYFFCRDDQ